jgi:hypothetical protein
MNYVISRKGQEQIMTDDEYHAWSKKKNAQIALDYAIRGIEKNKAKILADHAFGVVVREF